MKTCQKCGAKAENDDTFCPECGTKIKDGKIATKITVWSVLKLIASIIFFIIIINISKNNPPIAIILLILFLIWFNVINWVLKKIFNVELSIGVKILLTVLLVTLFLIVGTVSFVGVTQPKISYASSTIEGTQAYDFVKKINKLINSKDYGTLKEMLGKQVITQEVFEDISNLIDSRDYMEIDFRLVEQRDYGDRAELVVMVTLHTDYEKTSEKTLWTFNRKVNFENTNDFRWVLVKIAPKLSELKLSRSFEGEATSKIAKLEKPIAIVSSSQNAMGIY